MRLEATEHDHQVALFQWAARFQKALPALAMLFAIPNGGARHIATARRLKAEGVKPGVPDLMMPVARGGHHGLFIELKAKGGRATPEQSGWLERLRAQGYCAAVCVGWDSARALIENYLRGESV